MYWSSNRGKSYQYTVYDNYCDSRIQYDIDEDEDYNRDSWGCEVFLFKLHYNLVNLDRAPGVRFTKVFRTELGHKYILVECSVIALCLPVMSKITHYKLVCYK